MADYRQKVICLTKRPGQSFGFYLRVEHGQEGHLVRSLEMGGPAELAGMKDGDRIVRVNGTFTDELSHSELVDLVRSGGSSVTFHILDEDSYKQAKARGVNLSKPSSSTTAAAATATKPAAISNGMATMGPRPKLCYLVKSGPGGYGFSLRSVKGEPGVFLTEVTPGGVADRAGVKANDRVVEVNGDGVEEQGHEQLVERIKQTPASVMFLVVDEETDRDFRNRNVKIEARWATTAHLPHQPRTVTMSPGSDGYGFLLREEPNQSGHFIRDIDRNSPADRAGLKDMDRLVGVDGQSVDGCSHRQVVDMIKESGKKCCLLVVDEDTDLMFKQGKVSPFHFAEGWKDPPTSPPSYTEAVQAVAPVDETKETKEELKPKLCRMEKTAMGFGFRLNGIQGVHGQYIKDVAKDGAADRAGLEDEDMVVEVNGTNVERSSHDEVVQLIRAGGDELEMLVAKRSVYDALKAEGVAITRLLLRDDASYVEVHAAQRRRVEKVEEEDEEEEEEEEEEKGHRKEARAETPTEEEEVRERVASVSSVLSDDSVDERF